MNAYTLSDGEEAEEEPMEVDSEVPVTGTAAAPAMMAQPDAGGVGATSLTSPTPALQWVVALRLFLHLVVLVMPIEKQVWRDQIHPHGSTCLHSPAQLTVTMSHPCCRCKMWTGMTWTRS